MARKLSVSRETLRTLGNGGTAGGDEGQATTITITLTWFLDCWPSDGTECEPCGPDLCGWTDDPNFFDTSYPCLYQAE